jgi:hypothetical protein
MKRPIEKPLDPIMKFFTPELYLRYNSPDDDVADLADETWELAIHDYQVSLDVFRNLMPPRVRELVDGPSLHDAELIAFQADIFETIDEPSASPMAATISLKIGHQIVHLDYLLWDTVAQSPRIESWPFHSSPVHWLYDEVELDGSESIGHQRFCHKILFSNGRTVAVPFVDVIVSRFSPERPEPELVTRTR